LLAVKDESSRLRILVRPDWQSVVSGEDRDYLDALLTDLAERAENDPETLFQQLCSLATGPLATVGAGSHLAGHPDLLELSNTFKILWGKSPRKAARSTSKMFL